jgi:hypothetical protein
LHHHLSSYYLTAGQRPSWIFRHGYCVALLKDPTQIWLICRFCHQKKILDYGGASAYNVALATSSATKYLAQNKAGHRLTKDGVSKPLLSGGRTIAQLVAQGVEVPQDVANAIGSFDQQQFQIAAVVWLVENNHPIREFILPLFREMIELANPAANDALWVSHNSVSAFAMKLFSVLQPRVIAAIAGACSKIHISFDGWTTKGGKRGFLGIVAHFATVDGTLLDIPEISRSSQAPTRRVVNNQPKLQSSQMWPLLTSGLEYIGIAIPKWRGGTPLWWACG